MESVRIHKEQSISYETVPLTLFIPRFTDNRRNCVSSVYNLLSTLVFLSLSFQCPLVDPYLSYHSRPKVRRQSSPSPVQVINVVRRRVLKGHQSCVLHYPEPEEKDDIVDLLGCLIYFICKNLQSVIRPVPIIRILIPLFNVIEIRTSVKDLTLCPSPLGLSLVTKTRQLMYS